MVFPEKKMIHKIMGEINFILENWTKGYLFGWGFCTECNKWTFHLHDSSDQGWHCESCCNEKDLIRELQTKEWKRWSGYGTK